MFRVTETHINETEGYRFDDFTYDFDGTKRELFRYLQREYGRCGSRMYADNNDGSYYPIGWVFERMREYDDDFRLVKRDKYNHVVWVHVREVEDAKDND